MTGPINDPPPGGPGRTLPMTHHRPSTRATVYLCLCQALVLAGLLLTLTGLPTDPADDGPDFWWRDATTAEQAAHAAEQASDLEAALAQARS